MRYDVLEGRAAATKKRPDRLWNYPEKLPRKTTKKISAIQTRIVDFLSYNTKAIRGEIATYISNITEDGVKYHLKALQNKGIINISLGFISHRMSIVDRYSVPYVHKIT